jgi:hypothetical protein
MSRATLPMFLLVLLTAQLVHAQEEMTTIFVQEYLDEVEPVELVISLYDQPQGGALLYQLTKVVTPEEGIFDDFIEVPAELLSQYPQVFIEFAKASSPAEPLAVERMEYTHAEAAQADRPHAAAAQANCEDYCDEKYCYRGSHEDVIARFDSGRTIRACAAILRTRHGDDDPQAVKAYMKVWATGVRGNPVPGSYTVKDFHFKAFQCSSADSCSLAKDFVKCTGTGVPICKKRTTPSDPVAVFVGSVWRDELAYSGWRTRADDVSGVILNTTDSTKHKCVSSRLVHIDHYHPPSC